MSSKKVSNDDRHEHTENSQNSQTLEQAEAGLGGLGIRGFTHTHELFLGSSFTAGKPAAQTDNDQHTGNFSGDFNCLRLFAKLIYDI